MRFIYATTANRFQIEEGKPLFEVVLHSFEGSSPADGK